jgi:hypothetical protein
MSSSQESWQPGHEAGQVCGNVHRNITRARLQPLLLYPLPFHFPLYAGIFKKKILRITWRQCDSASVIGLCVNLLQIRFCGWCSWSVMIWYCAVICMSHITVFRDGSLCFWLSCSLNMKALRCTNTPSARRYNPEDLHTETHHFVNLKSRIPLSYLASLSVCSK